MKDEENMNSKISFYIFKTKIIKLINLLNINEIK